MNLQCFVDERLKFIRYFYEQTVSLFEQTKRKIEAGEPPYVDTRDPAYADEPAFLEEWEDADAAVNIVGATCLQLLQTTLHSFLNQYMREIGGVHPIPGLRKRKKESWFESYRTFFLDELKIDWTASGADIALLEQVNLTRNSAA